MLFYGFEVWGYERDDEIELVHTARRKCLGVGIKTLINNVRHDW